MYREQSKGLVYKNRKEKWWCSFCKLYYVGYKNFLKHNKKCTQRKKYFQTWKFLEDELK